jgi:hypothetical protein
MTKLEQLRANEADAQLAADGALITYDHALEFWQELIDILSERDPEVEEAWLELRSAEDHWIGLRKALRAAQHAYFDELEKQENN